METRTQLNLANMIQSQLHIESKNKLDEWKKNPYKMDPFATVRFWDMVKEAPAIYIVGDYDCDGVCACYNMSKAIRHNHPKKPVRVRIPHRITEGFGINKTIVEEIKEKMPKGSLIITVDNGIAAADLLEELRECGYKVILTDHHELGDNRMPDVDLLLNPKVPVNGHQYFDGDYWCGAAVAYKIAENYVNDDLRRELEVFAGIATVGDVMPLKEGNWGLVRRTIESIRHKKAPRSVLNLLSVLKQEPENVIETSLSFYLVPAINAPGRLFDDGAKKSLGYFLSPTEEKCIELKDINEQRKALRDEQLELIKEEIVRKGMENDCPIWVSVPGLHEGIVGILAGQIAEEYNVPAIVMTESSTPGVLKGSARSAGDINIFEHLCSFGDIFVKFGGHAGAAGLSIKEENVDIARSHQLSKPDKTAFKGINLNIEPKEIKDVAQTCEDYRPFGEGNEQPLFTIDVNLKKTPPRMLGNPAVHLCIQDPNREYKVLHFFHEPNELKNKDAFSLTGEVHYETFREQTTPVFHAESICDCEEDLER